MEIKTKYNVNDKIAVKDYKDNIILTTINRIETYATDTNLDIKYITNYGVINENQTININENQTININEFLNELNDINTKKKDNSSEVITMSFTPIDKAIKYKSKPKYNVGQLVEYNYKGEKYISSIVSINTKDKNITYKLKYDNRDFVETEIRPIKLNIGDNIVYFRSYKTNRILYYSGTIIDICSNYVVLRHDNGYNVNILYNQILRRI